MSKTPETDAEKINKRDAYLIPETSEWIVTAEFAEKLECQRDEARSELERVRKELVDSNRGAERNAHINNSLCSKLIQAERERDEVIKQKVLGFNALRSAWSVIDHALKEER